MKKYFLFSFFLPAIIYSQGNPLQVSTNNRSVCAGECISLTATASGGTQPYTYSWSPGGFTGNPLNICPATTTSYTVLAIDFNGLSASAMAVVTVNPNPIIIAAPKSICPGECVSLMASGGLNYTWIPNIGTGAGPHAVCPQVTTTYTVAGSNAVGCTTSTTVVVTVNPKPTITGSPATISCGLSATITTGGGTSYTWNTGSNTASITVSPTITTTYTVTGTNAQGCTGSREVVVTVQVCTGVIEAPGERNDLKIISINSSNRIIQVEYYSLKQENLSVQVTDITGRKIYSEEFVKLPGYFTRSIFLNKIPHSGMLLLSVQSENGVISRKILIDR